MRTLLALLIGLSLAVPCSAIAAEAKVIEIKGGKAKPAKGKRGKKGKAVQEESTADIVIKDDEPDLVALPGGKKRKADDVVLVDGKPIGTEDDVTPPTKKTDLYVDDPEEAAVPATHTEDPAEPAGDSPDEKKFKRH